MPRYYILLLLLAGFCRPPEAGAQAVVSVSFATTNVTPLNPGFAGFCTEMLASAVEYYDTNFEQITATLSPGWLRYPGGALEDAFQWTNGMTMTNVISQFPPAETNLLNDTVKLLPGKGGALFSDFAAMCANVGGAKIVVTINGFKWDRGAAWGPYDGVPEVIACEAGGLAPGELQFLEIWPLPVERIA